MFLIKNRYEEPIIPPRQNNCHLPSVPNAKMKTSERLLRTCIFREIAKVPKVQFLSPKVQFSLLTIWKFQKFFVSLHLY